MSKGTLLSATARRSAILSMRAEVLGFVAADEEVAVTDEDRGTLRRVAGVLESAASTLLRTDDVSRAD